MSSDLPSGRALFLGGALLSLLLFPAASNAQSVAIEHQDMSCMVAGQFPVLDACFRPGPGLARARVYFRPEGVPNWYYVEAKTPSETTLPDASCLKATLPKPKKSLVKQHVEYYVEATGKGQESSQTETFRPLVVENKGDCKGKPVAAFLPSAVVQVFPSVPAAFAAGTGLSTAAAVAVVGGGVAATTGTVAAVAASNGDSTPAPTTQPPPIATTQPPVTTVPPGPVTTTTTLPPAAFNPVFKVFKNGVLEPGPTVTGTEPVQLRFFMCESTGPLPLKYNVSVNGTTVTAGCDSTITFTAGGYTPGFGAMSSSRGQVRSSAATFSVLMQMQSDGPGNNPKEARAVTVQADPVPPPTTTTTTSTTTTTIPTTTTTTSTTTSTTSSTSSTTTTTMAPCSTPTVFLESPFNGAGPFDVTSGSAPFRASVSFAPASAGFITVTYDVMDTPGETTLVTSVSPFDYDWSSASATSFLSSNGHCPGTFPLTVFAKAEDARCSLTGTSSTNSFTLTVSSCPSGGPFRAPGETANGPTPAAAWISQLDVPGGRGQVVVNGSSASFPGFGRASVQARAQSGENRVEATLVQATGQPGLWRFELGDRGFTAGSLRVIAGQSVLVTGNAVVFRMKGGPGERVVFTFRAR